MRNRYLYNIYINIYICFLSSKQVCGPPQNFTNLYTEDREKGERLLFPNSNGSLASLTGREWWLWVGVVAKGKGLKTGVL